METIQFNEKRPLPKITELFENKDLVVKLNDFTILCNQQPNSKWIKKHPLTNQNYLPIERIEFLLSSIFVDWSVEIIDSKMVANSILITVRLHYTNPITGKTCFQDGIGAAPLQTDKDAGAVDFNKIKSSAVQTGAPAAESFAIKDAAEKLGRLFGKDLNRRDIIDYNLLENRFDNLKDI